MGGAVSHNVCPRIPPTSVTQHRLRGAASLSLIAYPAAGADVTRRAPNRCVGVRAAARLVWMLGTSGPEPPFSNDLRVVGARGLLPANVWALALAGC
jgi:hypothetical protein